jgi:hypothetical protein
LILTKNSRYIRKGCFKADFSLKTSKKFKD